MITGLPVRPSYKFGFWWSVQENGLPGEGRHEGLVPRNDVLTNGLIGFFLAQTLARILFVPRLRPPPQKPRRRCEPEEGYLRQVIHGSLHIDSLICYLLYLVYHYIPYVYPSNTVYPVYPYISCIPMFTLVVLYTLYTHIYPLYPCLPY